jgi:hypothetical protein
LPFALLAQTNEPFKKANTIVIQTNDDQPDAMQKLVTILTSQGYGIQTAAKDLGVLTTTAKGFKSGATTLNIQVNDKQVILRGSLFIPGISAPIPIEYKGANNSPAMRGWLEMENVAKAYAGATLNYL